MPAPPRRQLLAYGNFVALAGCEKLRGGKFARAEQLDNFWDGEPCVPSAPTDPVTVNGTCLMVARNVLTVAPLWHAPAATHFASVSGGGAANMNSSTRKPRVVGALRIPWWVLWRRRGERQPPSPETTFHDASEEVPSRRSSRRGDPPVSPSRKLGPMRGAEEVRWAVSLNEMGDLPAPRAPGPFPGGESATGRTNGRRDRRS
jgi:hypothetical protein